MSLVSPYVFRLFFHDFLASRSVDWNKSNALAEIVVSADFMNHADVGTYWGYGLLMHLINMICMSSYFVPFWVYVGATPGKMLTKTRIVIQGTDQKLSIKHAIIRFACYPLAPLGIWFILLDKQRRALHDKMSGTTVVVS